LTLTDQTDIITNLTRPYSIALDVEDRMLYWTDSNNGSIGRCYLNGTGREVVIDSNLQEPKAIALDTKQR